MEELRTVCQTLILKQNSVTLLLSSLHYNTLHYTALYLLLSPLLSSSVHLLVSSICAHSWGSPTLRTGLSPWSSPAAAPWERSDA